LGGKEDLSGFSVSESWVSEVQSTMTRLVDRNPVFKLSIEVLKEWHFCTFDNFELLRYIVLPISL
jgi:hypothetical protein